MGWIDQRGSEVLGRNECLRLLAVRAGGVGRIGLVDAGHAVIEPMNYRMFDHDILIQVGPGLLRDAAERRSVVSFEVDSVEPCEAWSVAARGPSRRLDDPVERALPERARPLVPEPGSSFVMIRTDVLTGRRFPLDRSVPLEPGGACREVGDVDLRRPVGLPRDVTVREAAAAMEEAQISSVLLGDHPSWLVSEHDLVGALAAGLGPDEHASDVATRSPLWITTTSTLVDAVAMMARHCVQHLVVITPDGMTVGVLSRREAMRQLLATRTS